MNMNLSSNDNHVLDGLPPSKNKKNIDFGKRRQMEIKKQVGVLSYRRDRLERELSAINSALLALDKQMDIDKKYEQLSMCD